MSPSANTWRRNRSTRIFFTSEADYQQLGHSDHGGRSGPGLAAGRRDPAAPGPAQLCRQCSEIHRTGGIRLQARAVEEQPGRLLVRFEVADTGAGLRTEIAKNGRIAVDKVRTGRFDLVLMDMQMPELDGLETTRAIRRLPGPDTDPIPALLTRSGP
jgi:hypothetical protein